MSSRALASTVDIGDDEPVRSRVYFILNTADNLVKVGYTTDLAKRLGDLQTGSSAALAIILYFKADRAVEAAIHHTLRSERVRGEWFRMGDLTTDVIDEISDYLLQFEDDDRDGRDHVLTAAEFRSILSSPNYGKVDG